MAAVALVVVLTLAMSAAALRARSVAGVHPVDWPASRRRVRHRPLPWRRVSLGVVAALLFIGVVPEVRRMALGASARLILLIASPTAPDIGGFADLPEVTEVVAADGTVVAELAGEERRVAVHLDALPPHVRHAVLAAEDKSFYAHRGVDAGGVFRGLLHTSRGRAQGGSTITQQLAKINYTAGERTVFRKFREAQYVTKLEARYSKDELLERYLNQVYFGEQAYGLGSASLAFFGVAPADLTPAQAAMLAGKIRSPERLDPRARPNDVRARRDRVLRNMRSAEWLSATEYSTAVAEPLSLAPLRVASSARAPHFVEFVKREAQSLDSLGGDPATRAARLFSGGYRVETTLDLKLFDATATAVRQRLGAPNDPVTATATVEPGTGAIRSLFGGLDFTSTQFDVSSRGTRQPGSAFKPFVYLAALRAEIDPRSTFDGASPMHVPCYGDKEVRNYAGEDAGGFVDLDSALIASVNVVFVQVGCMVGVRDILRVARDAGVPEDATEAQGAIFLGGLDRGVSALTMAAAYATFAADGVYAPPFSIARIVDRNGKVIHEHKSASRPVFRVEEVRVLNAALLRVVTQGTGRAAAIGRPVAGKTGTTQENIDAWFVGYTPQLATAVWVGYEPKRPMTSVHGRNVTGGSFPAQIFSALMGVALEGVPSKPIAMASPDALVVHVVNTTTTSTTSTTVAVVVDPVTTPALPLALVPVPVAVPAVDVPLPSTTTLPTTTTVASTSTTSTTSQSTTTTTSKHPQADG